MNVVKLFLHDVLREGSVMMVVSPDFTELVISPLVISLDVVPGQIKQYNDQYTTY